MGKTVFIVGASSGIGAALAGELAARGYTLGLFARRHDRLEAVAEDIRQRYGARVATAELDVCQQESVAPAIAAMRETLGGVDIVIANAGVLGARRSGDGNLDRDRRIIETNLMGAIATLDAAVGLFRQQGGGQVVGISSVSAYRGIPGSAAYSASKAALSNYLDALRMELGKHHITVTAIHPGFVNTDIAPGMEKYPFSAEPEAVAREIANAVEKGVKNAIVPRWPWAAILPALRLVPDSLIRRIF